MNPFKKETKQLSIFVTAGYPKIDSLNEQLEILTQHEVDFVEVGIPFSDPLADGPTIQKTSEVALENGMNLELLFEQLNNRSSNIPLVLMGYLNPIIAFGIDRFLASCIVSRVKSVILPDMSFEIYDRFYRDQFEKFGVSPCFLITPSTENDRISQIAQICSKSFVYLVSSNATTGGASNSSQFQTDRYKEIQSICGETLLFIGFGIDNREKVKLVQSVCDGAIIGSAYLKALGMNNHEVFLNELR